MKPGQLSPADVDRIVAQFVSEGFAVTAVAYWIAGRVLPPAGAIAFAGQAGGELTLELW